MALGVAAIEKRSEIPERAVKYYSQKELESYKIHF